MNMFLFKKMGFFVILLGVMAFSSYANEPGIVFDKELFRGWVVDFTEDARKEGISDTTIYKFMENAEFLPKVVELDRRQPDKTKTFNQYVRNLITDKKVDTAKQKYAENRKLLEEVAEKYNVQPRFIVALWAIESDFGRNMGGFNIVNSLTTLAYEGRRAEFFRKELINALKIIDAGHVGFDNMKGSWAGAMGQTQFMPTSFLTLAVDYNEDGKTDIWQTKEDIFGSIANYLAQTGWDSNSTWGREVILPENFDSSLIGKDVKKTLREWSELGIRKVDGTLLPTVKDMEASIIKPENEKGKAYIVYSNYMTILKWNRSLYFATTVGMFSDRIM